mgnify:CR=1 FL=1
MELKHTTTEPEFKIIKDNKDEPDLKTAQDFVGGMVEVITFPNGDVLIVNEEGKLNGLPINSFATGLYANPNDYIVGNVMLIHQSQID